MPRPALVPLAAALLALPLAGCERDGSPDETTDPEAAQVSEEQDDVRDAKEALADAKEDLEDADDEIAEQRGELREAILDKEEQQDAVGDARRQLAKEMGDLEAEQTDAEPDLTRDMDLRRADGATGAEGADPAAADPPPAEPPPADPDVKVEADPGVDVEVKQKDGR